jgi:hypothetical protein
MTRATYYQGWKVYHGKSGYWFAYFPDTDFFLLAQTKVAIRLKIDAFRSGAL